MEIKLSGHHRVAITPGIRRHVEEEAEHLRRIFDGISTLHVIFHDQKPRYVAEFVANVSHGAPVVAKASGATVHAAIERVAEKFEAQLRRHKEKARDHRAHEAEAAAAAGPRDDAGEPGVREADAAAAADPAARSPGPDEPPAAPPREGKTTP